MGHLYDGPGHRVEQLSTTGGTTTTTAYYCAAGKRISSRPAVLVGELSLRGRGIGRAIMAWAEDEAGRQGCTEVTIGVRIALPGNLAFFRKLGYDAVGEHAHAGYDRPTSVAMRKLVLDQRTEPASG